MKRMREILFVLSLTLLCTLVISVGEIALRPPPGAAPDFMNGALRLVAYSIPIATASNTLSEAFQNSFIQIPGKSTEIYRARRNPNLLVCEQEGNGMWGKIRMLVAYDEKANKLVAAEVLSQSETPGLGTRIAEADFKKRFENLAVSEGVRLIKGIARPDFGEVQAITGATISSDAVVKIVNAALERMKNGQK